jgi:hypothetical protein
MNDFNLDVGTAKYTLKTSDVSLKTKRGDKSNNYFIIVYNILLTISIGIISIIPNSCLHWYEKILLFILISIILYFTLFINRFRNFIVKIFSKLENHEEVS